jgi:hypothetical protein
MKGLARIIAVAFIFAAGWIGGSVSSRTATAQVPGVGDAMKAVEGILTRHPAVHLLDERPLAA